MEQQAAEKGAQGFLGEAEDILQLRQHRLVGVEIGEVLIVVAHGDARAHLDAARKRPQLAEERLQQARLPGSIRPDDGHSLAGVHGESRHGQQLALAISQLQAIALKDEVAGDGGSQADADLLVVGGRRDACQAVEPCLTAARLAGALPGFVAADELLGSGDVVLLRLVFFLPDGPAFAAQPNVLPVIPGVPLAQPGLKLKNVIGRVLEEPAVVGDDQHAGFREAQKAFQPLDRLEIEVIRRFVEQEQVGVLQQEPGERQAPALPAAERARGKRLVGLAETHAVEDFGHSVVVGVAIEPLVLVLNLAVVFDQDGLLGSAGPCHGGLQPLETSAQAENVGPAVERVRVHTLVWSRFQLLGQVGRPRPWRQGQRPGRRGDVAGDRLEQARLATAVGAHDPQTLAGLDLERQVAEHLGSAVHQFESLDAEKRHVTESLAADFWE